MNISIGKSSMNKQLNQSDRKLILNNILKLFLEEKINIPQEAWVVFKQFVEKGHNQMTNISIPSINRILVIKLYNSKKKKSSIVLKNQLTQSVRQAIVNEAMISAMDMQIDIPEEAKNIFNEYVTTGKEQSVDIVLSQYGKSMVIRLYNNKEKKSYVCLRKL
jgi:hypothetical protein